MSKMKWYNTAFMLPERMLVFSVGLLCLGASTTQITGNAEISTFHLPLSEQRARCGTRNAFAVFCQVTTVKKSSET